MLVVVFVTAESAVLEAVASKKTSLVPADLRANGFSALGVHNLVLTAFDTNKSKSINDFVDWLRWEDASGVIVISDESMPSLAENLGDHFSVHLFEAPSNSKNVDNVITSVLAKCLRAFRFFAKRFTDKKYQQIFRLPLRNFDAPEIVEMRKICRDMTQRNYGREIDALLKDMRKRQKPKKASAYPEVYLVDDKDKHFKLGPERHAQAETSMPPHNAICVVSNNMRFGHRFDGSTHYNVSRDKNVSMKGIYEDCHGILREHGKNSHLNMFTSDFF
ncbi:hypothetical protein H4P12_12425 [Paracoccus sp. 11-3]|uniref:Uncharacterized protein n=1 Tax=Paracoccus amoyensis TaxID=2760093 RepID=A0A926JBU7_9RHOB|nr:MULTISPECIES: hypothetical protein [Paracoccus]MBC9247496.1 hypothetical protein [Paracoccus amoyensis]NHF74871.1 hypothetical protein [Paracoccus xiamenensis]